MATSIETFAAKIEAKKKAQADEAKAVALARYRELGWKVARGGSLTDDETAEMVGLLDVLKLTAGDFDADVNSARTWVEFSGSEFATELATARDEAGKLGARHEDLKRDAEIARRKWVVASEAFTILNARLMKADERVRARPRLTAEMPDLLSLNVLD